VLPAFKSQLEIFVAEHKATQLFVVAVELCFSSENC
jgi:hypothetical protein